MLSPGLAHELARTRERDVQRAAARFLGLRPARVRREDPLPYQARHRRPKAEASESGPAASA